LKTHKWEKNEGIYLRRNILLFFQNRLISMEIEKLLFWIGHASFYMKHEDFVVFIDPFNLSDSIKEKADMILVTHAHFDHFSRKDIDRVMKPETVIVTSTQTLTGKEYKHVEIARPGYSKSFACVSIEAIPAYNVKKDRLSFHPKSNDWVGYVVEFGGKRIFHAGDTDFIEEMKSLSNIDAALLPMGGTYTMDVSETIEAANAIKAKATIPMHYKAPLGREASAESERKLAAAVKGAKFLKEVQPAAYSFE
jgi:L-ascorbate metabolism protein UlaG (beta-lactamase superfamily)